MGILSGVVQLDGAVTLSPGSTFQAPGQIIQVQSTYYENMIYGTNGGIPSNISAGAQLFSLTFTPKSASSKILVQTSTVAIHEESNVGDQCWLALYKDSVFNFANSATWYASNFGSGYNGAYTSLNHTLDSWGTSAASIVIRAGMSGSNYYINGATTYVYSGTSNRISMTIMEIAG